MKLILLVFAAAMIPACTGSDPVAQGAENTAGLPDSEVSAPSASGAAPNSAVATEPASPGGQAISAAIPEALRGRWALEPADCTTTRGDAKGLLVIDADSLKFYESRAVPAEEIEVSDDSVRGEFDFTGEGQSWSRFMALTRQGRTLIRTESNPSASFSYVLCD